MPSIFSKIIAGNLPCEKVFETESELAFLDIMPVSKGHTLVIPKREVIKLEELPADEASNLMLTLQKVAHAVSLAYNTSDYRIILNNGPDAGQEVPHIHFHIIPYPSGQIVRLDQRNSYTENEIKEVGEKIRNQIAL